MITLFEMQERLLSELEEAGQDNVCALLNTVLHQRDDIGLPGYLPMLIKSVCGLIRDDFVRVGHAPNGFGRLVDLSAHESIAVMTDVRERLTFSQSLGRWSTSLHHDRSPELVLTSHGYIRARMILSRRGYQWWVPIKR